MSNGAGLNPGTGVKAKDQEFLKAIIPTHTSIRTTDYTASVLGGYQVV
jgi:hypothetical protein